MSHFVLPASKNYRVLAVNERSLGSFWRLHTVSTIESKCDARMTKAFKIKDLLGSDSCQIHKNVKKIDTFMDVVVVMTRYRGRRAEMQFGTIGRKPD